MTPKEKIIIIGILAVLIIIGIAATSIWFIPPEAKPLDYSEPPGPGGGGGYVQEGDHWTAKVGDITYKMWNSTNATGWTIPEPANLKTCKHMVGVSDQKGDGGGFCISNTTPDSIPIPAPTTTPIPIYEVQVGGAGGSGTLQDHLDEMERERMVKHE